MLCTRVHTFKTISSILIIVRNSLGHSLLALEAVDKVVEKNTKSLGKDMSLKVQELLWKEFGHQMKGSSQKMRSRPPDQL